MARTTVPVVDLTMAGISVGSGTGETDGDVANGMDFVNDGNVFLHVRNTDATSKNVGLKCPLLIDGNAVADFTSAVSSGAEELIGPFPVSVMQQSNGRVNFDVNSTLLKIKAYRLPITG
jgi:hypothetical protein